MALVFMDSFDHYGMSDVLEKWTAQKSSMTGQAVATGTERRGSNAGDILTVVAPASPDATLADVPFVLSGTR